MMSLLANIRNLYIPIRMGFSLWNRTTRSKSWSTSTSESHVLVALELSEPVGTVARVGLRFSRKLWDWFDYTSLLHSDSRAVPESEGCLSEAHSGRTVLATFHTDHAFKEKISGVPVVITTQDADHQTPVSSANQHLLHMFVVGFSEVLYISDNTGDSLALPVNLDVTLECRPICFINDSEGDGFEQEHIDGRRGDVEEQQCEHVWPLLHNHIGTVVNCL